METAQKPQFIPGRVLCRDFFAEAVKPILASRFPALVYSAALVGPGSEVLGFDDQQSTDHHWGPRVSLFLDDSDIAEHRSPIHDALANELPGEFHGYSTHFSEPDPNDNGTQILERATSRPIRHRIDVLTRRGSGAPRDAPPLGALIS